MTIRPPDQPPMFAFWQKTSARPKRVISEETGNPPGGKNEGRHFFSVCRESGTNFLEGGVMKSKVTLEKHYAVSRAAVVREIGDEFMVIPPETSAGGMDNGPYILNRTGRAIWQGLDGSKSLKDTAAELAARFDVVPEAMEKDMLEFVKKLLKMNLIVEVSRS